MKEGRRQGFPFKHVERYTAKRPTPEAGQPAPGLLGQPEQLPYDGGLNAPEPQSPKGIQVGLALDVQNSQVGEQRAGELPPRRRTRVAFDCIHLPPSPEAVKRMLEDGVISEARAQKLLQQGPSDDKGVS